MPTPTNPPPLLPPMLPPVPAPAEPEYFAPPAVVARWERILGGHIESGDYLTLPPDALAWVEKELAFAQARLPGAPMAPGFRRDHLLRRTLDYHFGGKLVATLYRPEGVVVLAEGISAIGALLRAVTGDVRDEIRTETPHRW
jgi:hypothetical protein